MFLFLGWSYGSMGSIAKQLLFYLTLGGCGIWAMYRMFTLNGAIKKCNRLAATQAGMSADEMMKLNLI